DRVSWAAAPAARRLDGTPAVSVITEPRCHGNAAAVGRGNGNGLIRSCPKLTGSVPKHPPKILPTPAAAPPKQKEQSSDDPPRPAARPNWTPPSRRGAR